MKTFFSILTLTFFGFFFSQDLNAQTDDPAYVVVEYMKVKPNMWDNYRDCERAWKLVHQARIKAGSITGWELERVVYPSGTNNEYDFLTITHYKNWNAIGAENNEKWNAAFNAAFVGQPDSIKELANNAELYRDLIKREIWTAGDMVFAPGTSKPRYVVENYMKIPDGGWEAWMDMETKFVKPIHEKSIELKTRAGWLMGFMVLPRGGDYSYNASTIDYYNSWEEMGKDEGKSWEAIYPGMTDGQISTLINDTRKLVKTEVRVLADSVE